MTGNLLPNLRGLMKRKWTVVVVEIGLIFAVGSRQSSVYLMANLTCRRPCECYTLIGASDMKLWAIGTRNFSLKHLKLL
ncbi:hypothetical protein PsorP6_012750 [Peronosclerospora sorghi]|uniref:Uncharacterized protein n=1 Tax=Peronosclerospora sorghi TaxID=230839 RepID=A0ACC0WHP0_9STRA|nr:hypothetical protein PsorP6_012750 [Peronosclerospora sorghi]